MQTIHKRRLPMNNFTTELITSLAKGESIEECFRVELENAINHLLETELTVFLDYEKHDPIGYNSGDSRNGSYKRSIDSKYGALNIKMPRDREGEFVSKTVLPYKRRNDDLETTIIQLYSKGITTSEIADLIEKMYGHAYSKQTISNISRAVEIETEAFHNRPLNKRYAVVYCDATYLNVRRDSVSKEALHVVMGITPEGHKEIIEYQLFPEESSYNYKTIFKDMKARGCEEILMFVSDGLIGIRNACLEAYPTALHQSCWVHLQRTVSHLVRVKDRREVMDLLKPVYRADSQKQASELLDDFLNKVKSRYPKINKVFDNKESLFSFYAFPKEVHRSIYTTNLIENQNKQLKRKTKRKEQFPNEDSLDRFVCTQFMEYNQKFNDRVHKGFNMVQLEINEMFKK